MSPPRGTLQARKEKNTSAKSSPGPSPAMRQYLEMKRRYPDAILFFQLGDFFEMFYEDAKLGAKVLELALTSRQSDEKGPIPMCGVPCHSASSYCGRLLEAGYKVAICEQVEDAGESRGVVRREVTRVLTPGTSLADLELLDSKESQYLAGVTVSEKGGEVLWGMAWLDSSTGEFCATQVEGDAAETLICNQLERLSPRELILPDVFSPPDGLRSKIDELDVHVEKRPAATFYEPLDFKSLYPVFPDEAEVRTNPAAVDSAVGILTYLKENQPGNFPHLRPVFFTRLSDSMILDAATLRNLEITRSAADRGKRGTLFGLLDETLTGMGGRLLKKWVLSPLIQKRAIDYRAESVEELVNNSEILNTLKKALEPIQDIERLLGRVGSQTATARDLAGLGGSLAMLPEVCEALEGMASELFGSVLSGWDSLEDVALELKNAIVDDPPVSIREGGIFRADYDQELARLREAQQEGDSWLKNYESKEKERTGLPLKIGFNRVFGYYLEIPRRFSEQAPMEYTRKQTLVSAERYITSDLKKMEEDILGAEEKANHLEFMLFGRLRTQISQQAKRILAAAERIAILDAVLSLALVARKFGYVRPEIMDSTDLEIMDGRHPVMEAENPGLSFVPNDLSIRDDHRILIITGPNMAGKSTYLRQAALIVLMAQIGSFVPAKSAKIGLVDRVFTRVGAHDRILEGQSTFMVEMVETATILRESTQKSFIVLDEVGRGTSTYDGVSIAWSIVEYLHNEVRHRARTLFATHYHELAELSKELTCVKNLTVEVREWGDEIVFLRKVTDGSCDRSYGIQVGRLAGLPEEVIDRAKTLLSRFESTEAAARSGEEKSFLENRRGNGQLSLFSRTESQIENLLKGIDPDSMTPRQALETLYELRKLMANVEQQ